MQSKFKPLVISLLPCTGFCALLWSDGQQCETLDFISFAEARQAFHALCKNYPGAVRVVNGEVLSTAEVSAF